MPEEEIILDIEKEASNKRIYKIAPGEKKEKREYRMGRIKDDIDKRLKALSIYTGVKRFTTDIHAIQRRAFIKVLEKKGIIQPEEFKDFYFLCVDEDLRAMEKEKDNTKKAKQDHDVTNRTKKSSLYQAM